MSSNISVSANVSYCACISCPAGTTLDNGTLSCCIDSSAVGCHSCLNSGAGECLRCVDSYYLTGTNCTLCSSVITGCFTCTSTPRCTRCSITYYLNAGDCYPCNNTLSNCSECSSSTRCSTCVNDNFTPNNAGKCELCSDLIPNC